jgi:hypothetical protein
MISVDLRNLSKSELVSLAKKYTVYYVTKSGQGSTGNYERLTKEELIQLLKNDRDYQRDQRSLTRVQILKQRLKGRLTDPSFIMSSILELFGDSQSVPRPGYYCTYIYNAKTPGLLYDLHPLIAVLDIHEWGFTGINFHLSMQRNYTWPELGSQFCIIDNGEIGYLKSLPYRVLLRNP